MSRKLGLTELQEVIADLNRVLDEQAPYLNQHAKPPARPITIRPSVLAGRHDDRSVLESTYRLTPAESKSVQALMAYVAHTQSADEATVRAIVEAQFNVESVTHLQRRDYDAVIRFLVDVQLDLLKN